MAKVKAKDLRGKEDKELLFDQENLRKELFDMRFKAAAEGNANPCRIGEVRRQIARIETVLRERSLGLRGQKPR